MNNKTPQFDQHFEQMSDGPTTPGHEAAQFDEARVHEVGAEAVETYLNQIGASEEARQGYYKAAFNIKPAQGESETNEGANPHTGSNQEQPHDTDQSPNDLLDELRGMRNDMKDARQRDKEAQTRREAQEEERRQREEADRARAEERITQAEEAAKRAEQRAREATEAATRAAPNIDPRMMMDPRMAMMGRAQQERARRAAQEALLQKMKASKGKIDTLLEQTEQSGLPDIVNLDEADIKYLLDYRLADRLRLNNEVDGKIPDLKELLTLKDLLNLKALFDRTPISKINKDHKLYGPVQVLKKRLDPKSWDLSDEDRNFLTRVLSAPDMVPALLNRTLPPKQIPQKNPSPPKNGKYYTRREERNWKYTQKAIAKQNEISAITGTQRAKGRNYRAYFSNPLPLPLPFGSMDKVPPARRQTIAQTFDNQIVNSPEIEARRLKLQDINRINQMYNEAGGDHSLDGGRMPRRVRPKKPKANGEWVPPKSKVLEVAQQYSEQRLLLDMQIREWLNSKEIEQI